MKRKVIQIAESTQLISLPRKWAVQYGVKKGDELDVETQGDKIVVSQHGSNTVSRISVDVTDLKPFILRALAAVYKSGYDEVDLRFQDSAELVGIAAEVNQVLPGFEIIEQRPTSMQIRSVSVETESEFDNMLRRIFMITLSMAENVSELVRQRDYRKVRDALALEKTNNRLCNFCERLLNKYGYREHRNTTFIYCIVWELEKIADQYKYLCMYLEQAKPRCNQQTIELLQETHHLLQAFYETYYRFDKDKVAFIATQRREMVDRISMLFGQPRQDYRCLHHILSIVQMIFNLLGCYFGTRY